MTKQMLKVVKLAEKYKYVKYFASLDYIGKKELPCVKAIQESYASKYPVLLNQVTSEVLSSTESELATGKTEMKTMIDEYGKKLKKLTDDASQNTEIGPYMKAAQASPSEQRRRQQQRRRRRQQRQQQQERKQRRRRSKEKSNRQKSNMRREEKGPRWPPFEQKIRIFFLINKEFGKDSKNAQKT